MKCAKELIGMFDTTRFKKDELIKFHKINTDTGFISTCYYIERLKAGIQGGWQDYLSAYFGHPRTGGLNHYKDFNIYGTICPNITLIKNVRYDGEITRWFNKKFFVVHSGIQRTGNPVNKQNSIVSNLNDDKMIALSKENNEEFEVLHQALMSRDIDTISEIIRQGWERKKQFNLSVCNKALDDIINTFIVCGALAGKVSGGGNGGYLWFTYDEHTTIQNIINNVYKLTGIRYKQLIVEVL
jgi:galactokinase/mevalonate kinase-like predicted kinase